MRTTHLLTHVPPLAQDGALVVLRLAAAAIFIAHGAGDIFDADVENNVANYADAGIPLAAVAAPFAAYAQFIGGILMIPGLLVRVWSACVLVVMAGALIWVHRGEGLTMGQDGSGAGFALSMGAISLALLLLGPGRYSLDAVLTHRWAPQRETVTV